MMYLTIVKPTRLLRVDRTTIANMNISKKNFKTLDICIKRYPDRTQGNNLQNYIFSLTITSLNEIQIILFTNGTISKKI